jgi:hypothetical protein
MMGRSFGFLTLIIVVGAGTYLYTKEASPVSLIGSSASSVVDSIGIRNDLIAIAGAERRYFVLHAKYASLDELRKNGDTYIPTREEFTYSSEASETGFKISATYNGPDRKASRRISIDQTMSVKTN